MSGLEGLGSGPEGRLKRLRKHMTALFRHERIETSYAQCDETRGYAEKVSFLEFFILSLINFYTVTLEMHMRTESII